MKTLLIALVLALGVAQLPAQVQVQTGAAIVSKSGLMDILRGSGVSNANAAAIAKTLAEKIGYSTIEGLNAQGKIYGHNVGPLDQYGIPEFTIGGLQITAKVTYTFDFNSQNTVLLTFTLDIMGRKLLHRTRTRCGKMT